MCYFSKKNLILSAVALSSVINNFAWIDLSEINRSFDEMEKSIKRMRKEMHNDIKSEFKNNTPWTISFDNKSDTMLKIIIDGIDIQNTPQAHVNKDNTRLTIGIDNGVIMMKTLKNWVSLSLEQKIEQHNKTKKSAGTHMVSHSMTSSQTVSHDMDLMGVRIDYNATAKQLIIFLPYTQEAASKQIPVNMR